MPISIINSVLSTKIFIVLFIVALVVSIRHKKDEGFFPLSLTQELKGLAILAVVFSHVGYFLATDHNFLFPLSIMAGVGVNLFLFLSGYGLAISSIKEKLPIIKFYKKRLLKLLTPFWIVIIALFVFDFFLLHITYSWSYIIQSLLVFFPRADLFIDINSPFWFMTPLLFYYLIFPFVFSQKRTWRTAIFIYAISYFITQSNLPVSPGVLNLYQVHLIAFPLGIAFSSLSSKEFFTTEKIKSRALRYLVLAGLLLIIIYTALHSGIGEGQDKEQIISLITMSAIIAFFMIKKFEIRLLYIFGFFSYEIYMIHWPLMLRYDLLFKYLPGWLAMALYLVLFLIVSLGLRKLLTPRYQTKKI